MSDLKNMGQYNSRPIVPEPDFDVVAFVDWRALAQARFLSQNCAHGEVQWWHRMKRIVHGDKVFFHIFDIFVPEQEVSATEVDTSGELINNLMIEIMDSCVDPVSGDEDLDEANAIIQSMTCWAHSHVKMATNPSAQDEVTFQEQIDADPDSPRAMLIINHRDEAYLRIYDPDSGQIHDHVDIQTRREAVDFGAVREALKNKVKKKTYGAKATPGKKAVPPVVKKTTPKAGGANTSTPASAAPKTKTPAEYIAGTPPQSGSTNPSGKTAEVVHVPSPPPEATRLQSSVASDGTIEVDMEGVVPYVLHHTLGYVDDVQRLMDAVNDSNNAREEAEEVTHLIGSTLRDDCEFHILNVLNFYEPEQWDSLCDIDWQPKVDAPASFVEHLLDNYCDGELLCLSVEAAEEIASAENAGEIEDILERWAVTVVLADIENKTIPEEAV